MAADNRTRAGVDALRRRLEALESERRELLAELARLQRNEDAIPEPGAASAAAGSVNAASDAAAKIKLFISLFRDCEDVFARRWHMRTQESPAIDPSAVTSAADADKGRCAQMLTERPARPCIRLPR
jgi:hypothetical protein